jgi:hypothetical protein
MSEVAMQDMLTGAIALASMAIGVFFIRFWRSTRDRFFLYFALSFWIEALNRIRIGIADPAHEDTAGYYLIRLLAYGLILTAVWEKNRRRK